jgi:hypothetical protein
MVEYRKISIKKELADVIEKFVKAKSGYGYRSIAAFLEDAARRRMEEIGNPFLKNKEET